MENRLKEKRRYKTAQRIYEIMLMDVALKQRQDASDYDLIASRAVAAADAFIKCLYLDDEQTPNKNKKASLSNRRNT